MDLPQLLLYALAASAVSLTACAAPAAGEDAASSEGAQTTSEDRHYSSYSSDEVWLYGGDDADVPLGCVNCSAYASDSVMNAYGTYGSKYGSDTIWNAYGTYGSDYSNTSPWNSYGSTPPKLYTKDRRQYFGLFTSDKYKTGRTNLDDAEKILDAGRDKKK